MNYNDLTPAQIKYSQIDSDLWQCLEYNNPKEFNLWDVDKVLLMIEGDETLPWHWIIQLRSNHIYYFEAKQPDNGWDNYYDCETRVSLVNKDRTTFKENLTKALTKLDSGLYDCVYPTEDLIHIISSKLDIK